MVLASLLVAGTGCAGQSSYRPTEQLTAEVDGAPAARYPVPPESPRGDVTVVSRGVVSVRPSGGGERQSMLHTRLIVSNDNDVGPWTIDARMQQLFVAGQPGLSPTLVSVNGPAPPVLTLSPGQRVDVDLYFAVPALSERRRRTGGFELLWTVQTPSRSIAERTPFAPDEREPRYTAATAVTLGPRYWYDPFYYPAFYYPPVVYYGPGHFWHPIGPRDYAHAPRRWRAPPATGARAAPEMPRQPNISAPAPSSGGGRGTSVGPTSAPPPAPAAPASAPPSVPSQPNISAPAPR